MQERSTNWGSSIENVVVGQAVVVLEKKSRHVIPGVGLPEGGEPLLSGTQEMN